MSYGIYNYMYATTQYNYVYLYYIYVDQEVGSIIQSCDSDWQFR